MVSAAYAAVSALWIAASDRVVSALFAEDVTTVQTYKGWAFILVTASLLFLVLRRESRRCRTVQDALRDGETRQRRERGLFEAVLRQAPVGISIAEAPDGQALILNDRALGMMRMERTGEDARRYAGCGGLHAGGRPYATEDYPTIRALRHGQVIEREPLAYRCPGGRMFELEVSSAPVLDDDGRIAAAVTIFVDVTATNAAERALAESEERLRRAIEDAPFPVMVHADDGEVVHLSQAWLELTGYRREQIPTTAAWTELAFGARRDVVSGKIDRLYALDRPVDEGEYQIRTAAGRTRTWACRSSPLGPDGSGRRLVVSMAADVTERQENEERLRLLMREVDHRARNALAVVQAIVRLSRAEDPATLAEAVEGRIEAMARAHTLLAASRWAGADLARLATDELAAYGGGVVEIAGPPVTVRAEAVQAVSLALHELAINAVRRGTPSRPGGRIRVSWTPDPGTGILYLAWVENGGPPARDGFGSLLLHQLVGEQLGGELMMDWRPEGLACRMALPADTWQASSVMTVAEAVSAGGGGVPAAGRGRRVMVVEDEALTALAVRQLLETAGYEVLGPVGRVDDAVRLAHSGRPDAAVLDVNLFGTPVDPVADALASLGVPFLFYTGYHAAGTAGERHPRAPVLTKPVNANRLLAVVAGLLTADQPAASTPPRGDVNQHRQGSGHQ